MARRALPADRADWTFGQLIDFHLAQGTRPTGRPDVPGKYWSNKDFAIRTGVTEKTVRNWRRDRNLPNDLVSIERELFGQSELFAAYRAELREAHRRAQPSDHSPARAAHQIVHLPYSTLGSLFKGRVELIARLRESLLQQTGSSFACTALYGLGGVGKTRAAVEYAWAYGDSYPAIFFVPAHSTEALSYNLSALTSATNLHLPEQHHSEQEVQLRATLRWLASNRGWCLILDNVDTPAVLAETMRLMGRIGNAGHVIMTSRLSNFPAGVAALPLDVLSPDDASSFLLDRTELYRSKTADDKEAARHLAHDLGGLALALEYAGAYIAKHRYGVEEYRTLWRGNWDKVASWVDESITHYPRALAVTWKTSVEQLTESSCQMLERLSWLGNAPIPKSLIDVPLSEGGGPNNQEAMADLMSYSLARQDDESASFLVHRLVQEVTRRGLFEDRRSQSLSEAVKWIIAALPDHPLRYSAAAQVMGPLAPHLSNLIEHTQAAGLTGPTLQLMYALSQFYTEAGEYNSALPLIEKVAAAVEDVNGSSDTNTAMAVLQHGYVVALRSGRAAGKHHFERALKILRECPISDPVGVSYALNNLASSLINQRDFTRAQSLFEEALAIRKEYYGDHPLTASTMDNLAGAMRMQGDLKNARVMAESALKIYETVNGVDDPETAICVDNLATILGQLGDYTQAEQLQRRALAVFETALGSNHPNIATCLHNLAQNLSRQGRLAEANTLLQRVVEIDKRTLSSEHPDAKSTLAKLRTMGTILHRSKSGGRPIPVQREHPKIGRNSPCPCGSGKKYKHCHGAQS